MQHSRRTFLGAALGGLVIAPALAGPAEAGTAWSRVPAIRRRIRPPRFPARTFPITRYGATADGVTPCTEAFRRAVEACAAAGGGRVLVPAGTYLTGAIHLADDVELHLEAGATIRFSRDPADYLPVVATRYEGVELMNYSPFIYAHGRTNVAITGSGVIDGQADATHWWDWSNDPPPSEGPDKRLLAQLAEDGVPVAERVFGEGHYLRPNLIQLYRCRNVLIEGVTVKDSPMWNIHPVLCRNVTIRGVTVDSPRGPNNDGCDPESCVDVLIENCTFDTGDDCVALKAGKNADGRRVNEPCLNVLVTGCVMRDGNGGVTVGSETTGGVRWVFAWDCEMSSPPPGARDPRQDQPRARRLRQGRARQGRRGRAGRRRGRRGRARLREQAHRALLPRRRRHRDHPPAGRDRAQGLHPHRQPRQPDQGREGEQQRVREHDRGRRGDRRDRVRAA
ncbi:glycoside hydrolase family 28 protein [Nonomuraea salmonea]|uniref:glycoside hydrolase family 28 protein n=1 Tax=Nonomuraea salmonea TaxID=46181 RepID=UPI002FEBDB7F